MKSLFGYTEEVENRFATLEEHADDGHLVRLIDVAAGFEDRAETLTVSDILWVFINYVFTGTNENAEEFLAFMNTKAAEVDDWSKIEELSLQIGKSIIEFKRT